VILGNFNEKYCVFIKFSLNLNDGNYKILFKKPRIAQPSEQMKKPESGSDNAASKERGYKSYDLQSKNVLTASLVDLKEK